MHVSEVFMAVWSCFSPIPIRKPPNLFNVRNSINGGDRVKRVLKELQKETEKTLEWLSICSHVSRFTHTNMGLSVSRNGNLQIGLTQEETQKLLNQTSAAVALSKPLNFSGIEDVSEIVGSSVSGQLPSVKEFCALRRTLRSSRGLFDDLEKKVSSDDRYKPLLEILKNCDFLTELEQKIGFCIDCNLSIILDRASEKLEFIRSERRRNMEKLELLLKEVSTMVFQVGGIDSPLVTKRRSRMCVGIRASHRSLLPDGVILDLSSSGATYFMEPRDAVELNNSEVRLARSEKAEELAILSLLTSEIADSEEEIRHLMKKILELDLASARGAYARWLNGACPLLSNRPENKTLDTFSVDIESIKHPLLLESSFRNLSAVPKSGLESSVEMNGGNGVMDSRRTSTAVTDFPVPLDIKIGQTTKVVVISGPNTGGKTATMKTLGLASLMSKAGLYLPTKSGPRLPWFDHILADIGDHQSLEHNLSTFSGHISRLSKIMEVASEESLVLIDEIGNGTDPSEGVALSTSILQHLAGQVKLAVVTTHFADLSQLKSKDARFENAAMEFCVKTLQPTYRVLWGRTGKSNALCIAKSIGFDSKVLDRAQEWVEKLMPDKQKERKGLLYMSILEEKCALEAQAEKAASLFSEVRRLYQEILSEAEDLDKREAALKARESQQVRRELKAVKSQIDIIVKNFENQLSSSSTHQFKVLIRESEAAIASILEAHRCDFSVQESANSVSYTPQIGDQVHVMGFGGKLATVVEVSGDDNTALVQYGKMKVSVKKNEMKPIQIIKRNALAHSASHLKAQQIYQGRQNPKQISAEPYKDPEASYGLAVQTSKNTVDLRGMRVEEASHYLDMAILSSGPNRVLFVIHGIGTGVVKERALEILRNHPQVTRFEQEGPTNYGCTIAYIR